MHLKLAEYAASLSRNGCDVMVLTSSLAAFLHAVLINVQREQHVGVPSHFLVRVGRAGAARSDGSVQEESSFLSGRGPQLTLVLELRGLGQREKQG